MQTTITTASLSVRLVQTDDDKQLAFDLREQVFVHEQGFTRTIEYDNYDDMNSTWHFLGFDNTSGELVAVARAVPLDAIMPPAPHDPQTKAAKLGRIAIRQSCRGRGYGSQLLDAIETLLKQHWGISQSILNAQLDKKGFYEKCGYEWKDGLVFQEEGVGHCRMIKQLA